jgi:hypothetical protein
MNTPLGTCTILQECYIAQYEIVKNLFANSNPEQRDHLVAKPKWKFPNKTLRKQAWVINLRIEQRILQY